MFTGPRARTNHLAESKLGPRVQGRESTLPRPEPYQGLVGERVRVVDPLGGAVHISGPARALQRRDDLVMVLTAEQLGLTRVQGNPWGRKWKSECQEAQALATP